MSICVPVVTVSVGPEGDPLAISSDCSQAISWVKMGLPEWALRYLWAPPSAYVAGDALLAVVRDSGFVPMTVSVEGTSITDLEAKKAEVETALAAWPGVFEAEAVTDDETVTIAGPWETFPVVPGWGDVLPTVLGHHLVETSFLLPVNPPGAP